MTKLDTDEVKGKLYELCPEIEQLGLYTLVLGKGGHY